MNLETLKLQKEIKRNLLVDYRVDSRTISVTAVDGRVQVSGTVPTSSALKAVKETIESLYFPGETEIRIAIEPGNSEAHEEIRRMNTI